MASSASELTARWRTMYGKSLPLGYELRDRFPSRWVRFHSLPGSKRYADTEAEYAEILRRAHTVLNALAASNASTATSEILLISSSWSASAKPIRPAQLASLLPGTYWMSALADDSEPHNPSWLHLWISSMAFDERRLDDVLRLVADGEEQVTIAPSSLAWLFAPYDGGVDVIVASRTERDKLKAKFDGWLSAHPAGL